MRSKNVGETEVLADDNNCTPYKFLGTAWNLLKNLLLSCLEQSDEKIRVATAYQNTEHQSSLFY